MPRCIVVCGNTTEDHVRSSLEEVQTDNASNNDAITVEKPTENTPNTPDTHSVKNLIEENTLGATPMNTQEETPRCITLTKHKLTELLGENTEDLYQFEVVTQPPQDLLDPGQLQYLLRTLISILWASLPTLVFYALDKYTFP